MSNSKVFTADDGSKWELLEFDPETRYTPDMNYVFKVPKEARTIKPLKEDKKMKCTLKFEFWSEMSNESISEDYKFTPTQFKAVSEAIEALMEYITNRHDVSYRNLEEMADEAKAALND